MHETKLRFAFIETCLLWRGGLTAAQLANMFGITRPNAQNTISTYRRSYPDAIIYNPSRRRLEPGPNFHPDWIRPNLGRYLNHLLASRTSNFYHEDLDWSGFGSSDVIENIDAVLPTRTIHTPSSAVLDGIREREPVSVLYWSRGRPARWRTISPHALVHADRRYHARSFCHESRRYQDFVLSRIEDSAAAPDGAKWVSPTADTDWNRIVIVTLRLHPELNADMRNACRQEYRVNDNDEITLRVRIACLQYIERQLLRVAPHESAPTWQIVSTKPAF